MSFHVKYSFQKVFTSNQSSSTTQPCKIWLQTPPELPLNSVYSSTWQQMLFNRSVCTKPSDIKEPWVQKCLRESFRRKKGDFFQEKERRFFQEKKGDDRLEMKFKPITRKKSRLSSNIELLAAESFRNIQKR